MAEPKWKNFTKEEIEKILNESCSQQEFWLKLGYKNGTTLTRMQPCFDYFDLKPDFEKNKEELFNQEYIGKQYGRLTILEKDKEQSKIHREAWVKVQCSCEKHVIFSTALNRLKNGTTKSCGCINTETRRLLGISHREDLTGKVVNELTVIEYDEEMSKIHNRPYWKCNCSCGKQISISAMVIKRGQLSCGHLKSNGQFKVMKTLQRLKMSFEEEFSFLDLLGENKPLKFDFYLPDYKMCIECQGQQHYFPVDLFGGQEQFEIQQKYDNRKKEYCKSHNIKLIEIPYKDYNKINEQYILSLINS